MAARPLGRVDGGTNYATLHLAPASGVTVTEGDFVYFDGSGRITSASIAGESLIGVVQETVTGDADGTTALVIVDPTMRYLVDNDNVSTTFAATDVGQRYNLTGATGSQLVDTDSESATTGQLMCIEFNPLIDPVKDDTSQGVFVIVEHDFYPLGS